MAKAAIKTRTKELMERWKEEFDTVFAELFPGFNRNKRAITVDAHILKEEMLNFKIIEVEEVEP